jgi:hypothetical protein
MSLLLQEEEGEKTLFKNKEDWQQESWKFLSREIETSQGDNLAEKTSMRENPKANPGR